MRLGIKRRLADAAASAFDLVIFWEGERYDWPEKDYVARLFKHFGVECVFDVGANRGQYGKWLRSMGFKGKIISFEPQPGPFAILSRKAEKDGNWLCFPWALGREPSLMFLNQMASDDFSSFRQPTGNQEYAAENTVVGTIEVEVKTLDEAFRRFGSGSSFLKLDTQGFDLEVVAGGRETLKSFVGISSEVSMKPLYKNSPGLEDSIAMFEKLGFAPVRMFPVHPYEMFNLIEMNAYFVRQDLCSPSNLTATLSQRLIGTGA